MKRFTFLASALCACSSAFAQFSTGFESPPYNGSTGGTLLTGQDGWHLPPASVDFNVFTYAGNTHGVVANPTGGAQFAAGLSAGTTFARGQHNVDMSSTDVWSFTSDVLGMYTGTLPTAQNLGSLSSQLYDGTTYNLAHRSFIALAVWDDVATAASWSVQYNVFNAAGTATNNLSPGPAWTNLSPNHWYREETRVDFSTNQVIFLAITDLATNVTTTFSPTGWYLNGGSAPAGTLLRPNGVRMFGGGAAGNLFAFDNLSVPEPASLIVLGLGALAALRRRSKRS